MQEGAAVASEGGGDDRLSALPDAVLSRIVSHLRAREAVRTSVLSRRWRDVWASMTRVDVRHPCACDGRADQKRFHDFVKTLLLKRRPLVPIEALRLRWSHSGDANTWINHAVRRGAAEIELSARHHQDYPLPDYTNFVSSQIKILKLTHIGMCINDLKQLCSRCPCLEVLELKDVWPCVGEINSFSLKRLSIINCGVIRGLWVDAPSLISLRCIRPFGTVPCFEYLRSLVEATVVLDDSCLRYDRLWPVLDDEDDGSDHDDDFFAAASKELSDDKRDNEPDHADHGDDSSAFAVDDHGDDSSAFSVDEDTGYKRDCEPDDSGLPESCDKEDDDRTVAYGEIADECFGYGGPGDGYEGNSRGRYFPIYGGTDMLHNLSNVRTAGLLAHSGEVLLRMQLENCHMFNNLHTLSLGEWCMVPDFNALSTILEKSPNLESLYLHLDMIHSSRENINPRGGSFTCNNLNMVRIICHRHDVMVHMLAQFLHANGVPLERIFVRRSSSSTRNGEAGRGVDSGTKRKAQDETAKRAAKQRRTRSSSSPV